MIDSVCRQAQSKWGHKDVFTPRFEKRMLETVEMLRHVRCVSWIVRTGDERMLNRNIFLRFCELGFPASRPGVTKECEFITTVPLVGALAHSVWV